MSCAETRSFPPAAGCAGGCRGSSGTLWDLHCAWAGGREEGCGSSGGAAIHSSAVGMHSCCLISAQCSGAHKPALSLPPALAVPCQSC